jgi:hypothetical protein
VIDISSSRYVSPKYNRPTTKTQLGYRKNSRNARNTPTRHQFFLFFSLTPHFTVANQLSYLTSAMASSYWSISYAASSVAATTSLVLHPRNCKPQNPIFEVVVGLTNASTIKTIFVLELLYPTVILLKATKDPPAPGILN